MKTQKHLPAVTCGGACLFRALLCAVTLFAAAVQLNAQKVSTNTQGGTSTITHSDGTSVTTGKDGNITVNSPKTGTTTTVNGKNGTTSTKDNKTGASTTPVKHNPAPAGGAKGNVPPPPKPGQAQGGGAKKPQAQPQGASGQNTLGQGQGQQKGQQGQQTQGPTIDIQPNADGSVTVTITNNGQTETVNVHPQTDPLSGETTTTVTSPGDGKSTASVKTDKTGAVTGTSVKTPPAGGQSFEVTQGPDGLTHIYSKNANGDIVSDITVPSGYEVETGEDKVPHPVQKSGNANGNQAGENQPGDKAAPKLEPGQKFEPLNPQPQPPRQESQPLNPQPMPGNKGGRKTHVFMPPIASPGSTIVATVLDENDQPGPQDVIVGTVDESGKKEFFQTTADALGKVAFVLTTGTTAVELFRAFDAKGNPDQPVHTDVSSQTAHLKNSEPIPATQIPSSGPKVVEANTVVTRDGLVTLHTEGTNPLNTRVLMDNKPVQTLSSSDCSVVAKLPSDTPLGPHQFSVTSDGMTSNTYAAAVATIVPEQIMPMHTGQKRKVIVHVDGVPAGQQATMQFEVSGAARTRNGAPTTVQVRNGVATTEILGTHPGPLEVKFRMTVNSLWKN